MQQRTVNEPDDQQHHAARHSRCRRAFRRAGNRFSSSMTFPTNRQWCWARRLADDYDVLRGYPARKPSTAPNRISDPMPLDDDAGRERPRCSVSCAKLPLRDARGDFIADTRPDSELCRAGGRGPRIYITKPDRGTDLCQRGSRMLSATGGASELEPCPVPSRACGSGVHGEQVNFNTDWRCRWLCGEELSTTTWRGAPGRLAERCSRRAMPIRPGSRAWSRIRIRRHAKRIAGRRPDAAARCHGAS